MTHLAVVAAGFLLVLVSCVSYSRHTFAATLYAHD
jgi:hypothetical protein